MLFAVLIVLALASRWSAGGSGVAASSFHTERGNTPAPAGGIVRPSANPQAPLPVAPLVPASAYAPGGRLNPDICSNQEDNSHHADCSLRAGKFVGHYTRPSPAFVKQWNGYGFDRAAWDDVHQFPDFADLPLNPNIPRP